MIPLARALALLALVALPFHPIATRIGGIPFRPTEALVIAAIVASIPVAGAALAHWRRPRPFDGAVAAVVVLGTVALVLAPGPGESMRVYRQIIVEPALFYVVASRLFDGERGRRDLLGALLASGTLVALVGLGQYIAPGYLIEAEGVWRIRGPYASPNNLALYLDRIVPLALALAFGGRSLLAAGVAFVTGLAAVATFSLGGWIAIAAGATWALWQRLRWRAVVLPLVGVIAIAAAAAILKPERITSHLDPSAASTSSLRVLVWQASFRMALDHPWLGVGLDNFLYFYDPARTERPYMPPAAWRESSLSHPHNLVLDWWLSLGVGGLAALIWIGAITVREGRRVLYADGAERWVGVGSIGSIIAAVIHGAIDNGYFLPDLAILWWTQAAILAGIARGSVATPTRTEPIDPTSATRSCAE